MMDRKDIEETIKRFAKVMESAKRVREEIRKE